MGQSSSWWLQFSALTYKSWKVLWNRKLSLATLVFAPPVSVVVLFIIFSAVSHKNTKLKDDQIESLPSSLLRCNVFDLPSFTAPNSSQLLHQCVTVGYVGPDAKSIMQEVAGELSLKYGSDVLEFPTAEIMSEFIWRNPHHVDLAVVFTAANSYELWMNSTYMSYDSVSDIDPLVKSQRLSGRLLTLQRAINAAIVKQSINQPLVLDVQLGAFTDIDDDHQVEDVVSLCDEPSGIRNQNLIGVVGSTIIAIGVEISTIIVLMTLVYEKQARLTGKLRQMGLKESAHIGSWMVVFFISAFISSLLTVIIMKLVSDQLFLFHNSSFGVLFITLFGFHLAMIGSAFIIASLFTKPVWIIAISSTVFLAILISTMMMNSIAVYDDPYKRNEKDICFRNSNTYSSMWKPHTASHFFEFLIFWFPWISYGRITFEMYAATYNNVKSFSFSDFTARTHYLMQTQDRDVIYSAPSLFNSFLFMLGLWIVSMPLSWYLSQAFAGRMNGKRSWYFPIQPGYWFYRNRRAPYQQGDTFASERDKSQREGSLRIFKLSKTYKGGSALREVSVIMNSGEVFVLLGHNGAGKSTLINVLTGLTDATYGEAYFAGYSFKTDMPQIQSVCGICPQFDALWDELNAEEHLRVCAAMQGLRGKKANEEIKRVLAAVDLLEERKHMVNTFSGGMKRRLSVCMAVIGDGRKLIFLDEPTTGVDTINKKRIWQLVEKLKEDKIVVLTTHNMEEADALADKIAILHQGSLKAVGSSLFLKKEFGSGYQISLLLSSAEDAPEVEGIIRRVLPGAKIVQSAAGNLRVSLNHNSALAIPKLLKELKVALPGQQTVQTSSVLKEWGISNTTLEEVFLRLSAQNDQQVNEEDNKNDAENLCLMCGVKRAEVVTLYTRTGIEVKVPNAICLSCALAEQRADEHAPISPGATEKDAFLAPPKEKGTGAHEINMENLAEATQEVKIKPKSKYALFNSQIKAILYKNLKLSLAQKKSFIFYFLIFLVYLLLANFLPGGSLKGEHKYYYYRRTCPGRTDITDESGICTAQAFLNGFQNVDISWNRVTPNILTQSGSRTNATPIVWYSSQGNFPLDFSGEPGLFKEFPQTDFDKLFRDNQQKLQQNATPANSIQSSSCVPGNDRRLLYVSSDLPSANATYNSLFPSSGIAFNIDSSQASTGIKLSTVIRYKSHVYDAERIWIRTTNSTGCSPYGDSYKGLVSLLSVEGSSGSYFSSVAPFLTINAVGSSVLRGRSNSSIVTTLKAYPSLSFVPGPEPLDFPLYKLIFAIVGLSVFFPLYVRRLVMERQTGLYQMMSVAGMRPSAYWIGNYIYDFIITLVAASVFFIIGRVVGTIDPNPVWAAVVIIVWSHALNGMSTFTAGFFKSVRAASLFAVIGLYICAFGCIFINNKYNETKRMPAGAAVFPPLALARILFLLFTKSRQGELLVDLVVLLFASTALYLIGIFMNLARASPAPFSIISGWFKRKIQAETTNVSDGAAEVSPEDVLKEVEKVKNAPTGSLAIKMESLRKVFTRSGRVKVAVDNVTLGLEYGEIFGLLGANGAGKTTILSMLSGSLEPSGGTIEIGGTKLIRKNELSPSQLSICPQSDVVWKDLSVWTHFMFYAYLKGLTSAEARASIQIIAADLSLNGDAFHKKASSLSGGQLRRLSFGVSIVGSPSILLMDEITTGLDPVSKTTIWEAVKKQSNSGRLILLTTHSMEEADTLCTRIGIMSHGRMKCLGAPLYLKNRYSNGYTLTIATEQDSSQESITSLIQQAAPDATLVYTWRRVHKYSVRNFDLQYLFQLLEDDLNKHRYGIREWQIEQTTLQDVFLKVSEGD